MVKRFIVLIIFVLFNSIIFAQISVNVQGLGGVSEFASQISPEDKRAYEIKGSPYYNKDFMYGKAEMYDGRTFSGLFRYNMHQEEMEFIFKSDTFIINNPISIKYIHFAAKKFAYSVIVSNYWRKNHIYGGYFEVLNEGPCQLLIRYSSDLRLNRYVSYYGGGGGDGNYRYISTGTFYYRLKPDEPALKLNQTKKSIFKIFPNRKAEISKFIKENKIKLKEKNDLVDLFKYLNTF